MTSEDDTPRLVEAVERLCGVPVRSLKPLPQRGRNNRLLRADSGRGPLAVKLYPPPAGDGRDRLGTEFGALSFLRRHGVTVVPRPFASDPALRLAVYEWIDGHPPGSAIDGHIDQALDFLALLHELRGADGADGLPAASEACLCTAEILAQIGRRRRRLESAEEGNPALSDWLTRVFDPALDRITAQALDRHTADGVSPDHECPLDRRTLSPSDFGLHNALEDGQGRLTFLDFEYFGWDDPVKMVADVCLHPGMELDPAHRGRVIARAVDLFEADADFPARLARTMPLYALRWCLILLNEHLPQGAALRRFAGVIEDVAAVRQRQLSKADRKLAQAVALSAAG